MAEVTLTLVEIVGGSMRLTRGEDVTILPFGTVAAMANILREHLLTLAPPEIPAFHFDGLGNVRLGEEPEAVDAPYELGGEG